MKKLLSVILCLCFVIGMLAACGDAKTDNSSSDGSSVNTNETTYTVPDLVGKVADDVSKSADYKDVCAFEIVYEHSSKVEKGKIISQLPVAGETFGEKPTITLTVSDGANMVEVPNVYKKTLAEAKKILEEIGFTVIVYQESHKTVDKGLVYTTSPVIGSDVADDSEVSIYVSTGPDEDENPESYTTLPNLVGKTRFEAERLLAEAGLVVGTVTEVYFDTIPYGYVCSMSVKPGKITFGAVIDLTVSLGPETTFPAN